MDAAALLNLILFLPALGALAVLALGSVSAIRWTSLAVTTVTFVLSLALWFGFDPAVSTATAPQLATRVPWFGGGLDVSYYVGVDGLNLLLLLLTTLLGPIVVLSSWTYIGKAHKGYYALILLLQSHARKQRPGHILRRLAHGDLACFRAAVNFEKRRLQCRFGFARQLQRQGSGGTQNTFNTGKGYACIRQGLQMHGRGHQHARRGRIRQRVCHVGRVKRPFTPQAVPGHQRLQHNRLKAIHMLRGHRAHQTPCSHPLNLF